MREIWRPMAICSIVGRVSGVSWKLYPDGVGGLLSAGVEYMPLSCCMIMIRWRFKGDRGQKHLPGP